MRFVVFIALTLGLQKNFSCLYRIMSNRVRR